MMQFLGDVDKLIQQQKLNSPTDYNASSVDSAKQAAGEVGTTPSCLLHASSQHLHRILMHNVRPCVSMALSRMTVVQDVQQSCMW